MRRHALRTATIKGLLAFVMLFAPQLQAINLNPDIDELRQEAYAQYNRWITSRDVEKRRMAADGLGGHAEQTGTVTLLVAALPDKDSDVRRLAAHSLWKLSDDDVDIVAAHAALRSRLEDPSPAVRVNAAGALEASGVAAADLVAVRRSVLQAGDWFDIALAARDLIDSVDGTELVDPLLRAMRETPGTDSDDRFDAADVLQPLVKAHGARVAPGLMRALDDAELDRVALLEALGLVERAPADWQATLLRLSRDRQTDIRVTSVELLRKRIASGQAEPNWIEPALPLLQDPYPIVRREAAELFAAAAGDGHPAADGLIALLRDDNADVRRAAIGALGRIGDPAEAYDRAIKSGIASRARPPLEAIAADAAQDKDTRDAAKHALQALIAGTETHTKVLATTAPANAEAVAPSGAGALLDAGFRAGAKERETVLAMLQGEKDPAKRKLLTRALGSGK